MDHLFSAFMSRRASRESRDSRQNSSCGDIPDLYVLKKRTVKRASFGSRYLVTSQNSDCVKSMSNSELINVVDTQLMQIREKLAAFREQDTELRERVNLLGGSVSELTSSRRSSLSNYTPSECSDLGSLDEATIGDEEEEFEQQYPVIVGQIEADKDHFNRPPVRCFHMRQSSYPSSMYGQIELSDEEEMWETQRHCTYSVAKQSINLYPQYSNPEEISTLF